MTSGKEVLAVHEDRGTPGEARLIIVVPEHHRPGSCRETLIGDYLMEDAQGLVVTWAPLKVQKFYL